MKIAFIADVHVGNHQGHKGGQYTVGVNERCRAVLDVLSQAAQLATQLEAELVCAGDLFDNERPSPQLLAATAQALCTASTLYGAHLLLGNHDRMSAATGDHALCVYGYVPGVSLYDTPRFGALDGADVLMVPFCEEHGNEYIPREIAKLCQGRPQDVPRVLCIHAGILDADIAASEPWLANSHDSIALQVLVDTCAQHGIGTVFAGNWHKAKHWHVNGVSVHQVGALVPTGWDNPGLEGYGSVLVFDTETQKTARYELPGPRFLTVAAARSIPGDTSNKLYVRAKVPVDKVAETSAELEHLKEHGQLAQWEVLPEAATVTVRQDLSDVATVSAALQAYVADTVPATLQEEVLRRLCTYI